MALPISPGAISLANLQLQYGGQVPISLGEFYGFGNGPSTSTRQIDLGRFRQVAGPVPPNQITDGLLFSFDAKDPNSYVGTGSTWNDISGNSRNMTLVNSPTFVESQAINFAGTLSPLQYAQLSDAAWIPSGTSPRSYECYLKMNAWVPGQAGATVAFIWTKTLPNQQACSFGFNVSSFNSSGIVYLILGTQGGGNFSEATDRYQLPNPATYLGSYHQYGFTYDGDVAKMYIDGALVFTAAGKQFHTVPTAPLRWMVFDPGNANFRWPVNATMRGARLYNRALSDSEMANNYAVWTADPNRGVVFPSRSTITLGGASTTTHIGLGFTNTITFDTPVFGFNRDKIDLTNATKGTFTGAGGTTTYSLQIIPTGEGVITLGIGSTASFNAGNVGNNPVSATYAYIPPTNATLTLYPLFHGGTTFTANFNFDQPMVDFFPSDITTQNGTKGTFTGTGGTTTYSLEITPVSSTGIVTVGVSSQAAFTDRNQGLNPINNALIEYSAAPSNGLYLYLDANKSASYTGISGIGTTTWYDLTVNRNHFTINNGPVFNNTSPKHFDFNGTNDNAYRKVGIATTSEATWIVWFRMDSATQANFAALVGIRYGDTQSTNILGFRGTSNTIGYHWNGDFFNTNTSLAPANNTWYMLSLRVNSTSGVFNLRTGITTSSFTNTTAHGTFSHVNADCYIARDPEAADRSFNGDISEVLIYTRRLSDVELQTYYNATKSTYGL